jgi:hypothetical protein
MTGLAVLNSQITSSFEGFFKPVSTSEVEQLLLRYDSTKKYIINVDQYMSEGSNMNAISYLLRRDIDATKSYSRIGLSSAETALKYLDADFWQLALKATDVYEHMPQKRRDEWNENIRTRDVPEFEESTVISTLKELLLSRDQFLAERVDGLFEKLSGEHVTNQPQGFSKRMIIYYSYTKDWVESSRAGYINDLRCVVAKFLKRDAPNHNNSYMLISRFVNAGSYGEWHEMDGGSIRIKLFKKGTAHLEIHPDIAWRLNEILAFLHPMAIPAEFRKKNEKVMKKFDFTQNLIPHSVLNILEDIRKAYSPETRAYIENTFTLSRLYSNTDKHLIQKTEEIMFACGGVKVGRSNYKFDYDFMPVCTEIITLGSLPDKKAHQYYPTPDELAEKIVKWAGIESHHECLEPSAGQGGIVQHMPASTTCIEVSAVHCEILKGKSFTDVQNADFIEWAESSSRQFDRICMNPPFSEGRAEQHVNAAANMLKEDGILTAIVPPSFANRKRLDGFEYKIGKAIDGAFSGTGVSVIPVKLTRVEFA